MDDSEFLPSNTLNVNQANCLVERAGVQGREYINVCTGQTTLVSYSFGEYAMGGLMLVFLVFFAIQWMGMSRRMRR